MTKIEAVNKWIISAQEDLQVAKELFIGKRFAHALFFCHLSLEKILKAAVVNHVDDAPPITYDLVKLSAAAELSLTEEQESQLREITTFNVEARYDIHKDRLYKKATQNFTQQFISVTEELFLWIKNNIQ